jgi:hypothetical protein
LESERLPSSPSRTSFGPLALLGILVSSFAFLRWIKQANVAVPPENSTADKSENAPKQTAFIPNTIPPPQQNDYADWGNKRTPTWEKAAVVVALGILFVNTWQSCATQKAANAAQDAADTAHDTLVVSERPWITVTVGLNGPGLTFNPDGSASLNLGIAVKNIGHSVATGINIRPEMFAMSFSANGMFNEPLDKQSSFCEKVRKAAIDPRRLFTLFPTEDTTANITVTLTKADIDSAIMPFNKRDAKYVLPVIYGCVNYQFSFDKLTHQTQFIYELSQFNPVEPSHQFPIKIISGTVPLTNLVVRKYYFGGSLAD